MGPRRKFSELQVEVELKLDHPHNEYSAAEVIQQQAVAGAQEESGPAD